MADRDAWVQSGDGRSERQPRRRLATRATSRVTRRAVVATLMRDKEVMEKRSKRRRARRSERYDANLRFDDGA
jgi:hypothetical protein